ncbi:hypothetical protein J6590_100373 [Homalodisca vitripennis]|nr:hypothetical protein J6590_100373 [Homalodisca vitripennis]
MFKVRSPAPESLDVVVPEHINHLSRFEERSLLADVVVSSRVEERSLVRRIRIRHISYICLKQHNNTLKKEETSRRYRDRFESTAVE